MTTLIRARRIAGWLAAIALCAVTGTAFAREKTDIIELRNGDRVTCEIKNLERGQIKVSTDSMGTVYIEWKDVVRITSKDAVCHRAGRRQPHGWHAGRIGDSRQIAPAERRQGSVCRHAAGHLARPVEARRNDHQALGRLRQRGLRLTKANSEKSLSASFDARRRAESSVINFDGSTYSRSQEDGKDSTRATFTGAYRRLLQERWYWAGLGGLERNDELGIDLRSFGGGGYGRYLIQSGRSLWSVTGGLVVVNEQRTGEDGDTNLEALFNTDYEFFTYDTPKTSLNTSFTVYPSLTQSGRVRSNLDFALRRELITDFFVELSIYDSFDSDPPADGTKNDYGVVTSLGYTF